MRTIVIIGAGGNARELAGVIRDIGGFRCLGFLASTAGAYNSPTLGDFDWLEGNKVDCLAMGIGTPALRLSIGRQLANRFPGIEWPALTHPSAYVGPTCRIDRGAVICVRAVATENVIVEEFAQLNFGSTIGHESRIGPGVIVNPGANVSGGVEIGAGTLIGSGAKVLQYLKVGRDAIVGAGAVVTRNVGDNEIALGVPAKNAARPLHH